MREAIKKLILAGSNVNQPYKKCMASWYGEVGIFIYGDICMVQWPSGEYKGSIFELYKAIDVFGQMAYGKKNIANAIEGIIRHNLVSGIDEMEKLSKYEQKCLVRRYWKEFYEQDFHFWKEFEGGKNV